MSAPVTSNSSHNTSCGPREKTLPPWMRAIGHLLPPSYVFENMRSLVAGRGFSWSELVLSVALAALDVALAAWAFRAVHRHAVRTGLLARYSAESVS